MNVVEFSKQLASLVRERVEKAVETAVKAFDDRLTELATRLKAVEERPAPADGKDGQDGQDAPAPTIDQLREALLDAPELPDLLAATVATHLEANPVPAGKDGEDGEDGKDGQDAPAPTPEVVAAALAHDPTLLAMAVQEHLTANPPAAGQDGADGEDGEDAPAPTAETVAAALAAQPDLLAGAVAAYMEEHPPRDGQDGKDAQPEVVQQWVDEYLKANPPPAGKDGERGQDGTSVTLDEVVEKLDSMQATWALDFERRAMELFHNVVSKMQAPRDGKDGRDGVDGLGFDDLTMEYDGERTVKFVFARGEQRKEFPMRVPAIIHRGIYKKDAKYEDGDLVTWGGSMWLAKSETEGKQPGTHASWQLVVKHGRDGKDAT
jgi:integrin beta 3